jgi:hypothetical protein
VCAMLALALLGTSCSRFNDVGEPASSRDGSLLSGANAVAVEPASNMRAVLRERMPEVRAVEGTDESIPIDDAAAAAAAAARARIARRPRYR